MGEVDINWIVKARNGLGITHEEMLLAHFAPLVHYVPVSQNISAPAVFSPFRVKAVTSVIFIRTKKTQTASLHTICSPAKLSSAIWQLDARCAHWHAVLPAHGHPSRKPQLTRKHGTQAPRISNHKLSSPPVTVIECAKAGSYGIANDLLGV